MWRFLEVLSRLIPACLFASWLLACERKPLAEPTTSDWLDWCSPFVSLDEKENLFFRIGDHSVSRSPVKADNAVPSKVGTWAIDVASPTRVNVRLSEQVTHYTLAVVGDGATCLLANGTLEGANLRQSWFGEMSDVPDETERNQ